MAATARVIWLCACVWYWPDRGLHSRPQGPRSFWSASRIATSGPVQRHSGFEWRPEPIRFVRLDSEHAQSDGKSVNRRVPLLDLARGQGQRSRFLVLTKRSAASWDENGVSLAFIVVLYNCCLHATAFLETHRISLESSCNVSLFAVPNDLLLIEKLPLSSKAKRHCSYFNLFVKSVKVNQWSQQKATTFVTTEKRSMFVG